MDRHINSVLKHYDKAIMIMHQLVTDEYFLHELFISPFKEEKVEKVGGEGKKGIFLLKIITLAFLRLIPCKKLTLEI